MMGEGRQVFYALIFGVFFICAYIFVAICDRLWENRPLRAQLQNRVIGIQG